MVDLVRIVSKSITDSAKINNDQVEKKRPLRGSKVLSDLFGFEEEGQKASPPKKFSPVLGNLFGVARDDIV